MLAHAFGARYDLPIPLGLFILGGALVVAVSFISVRSREVVGGGSASKDRAMTTRPPLSRSSIGLAALAGLILCGMFGSQEIPLNIVPTTFWLIIWIALPLSTGVVGNWSAPYNPFAALVRYGDNARLRRILLAADNPIAWPSWLGWWPATITYFLGVCGELIFNKSVTVPQATATALLLYAIWCAFAGLIFGRVFLERGELFCVLLDTWGRLGYKRFGAPGREGFAGGLDVDFEPVLSRVAFVLLLLISVNFDGLIAIPKWSRLERRVSGPISIDPVKLDLFRLGSLITLAFLVALVFAAFASASARLGRQGISPLAALTGLLPSLVPISFGYLLAHNLQYVLVNGQAMAPLIGDPTGNPSWPLHLPYPFDSNFEPRPFFLPSAFYWYVALAAIIFVHVIAVFLAHRHLKLRAAGPDEAQRSEYPWLVAMIGYTMLSLWLLAQPLTQSAKPKPTPTPSSGAAAEVSIYADGALSESR